MDTNEKLFLCEETDAFLGYEDYDEVSKSVDVEASQAEYEEEVKEKIHAKYPSLEIEFSWDVGGRDHYDGDLFDERKVLEEADDAEISVGSAQNFWVYKTELEVLAWAIKKSQDWDKDLLAKLCALAGMSAEWEAADGETFESVALAAAKKLDVEIV